jgi:hypothetical protein
MLRVHHASWGDGVVIEERKSESGFNIARCVFDSDPETERTIVATFLTPSDKQLPQQRRKAKRKSKPKPEPISDELLVAVHDAYMDEDPEETGLVKATSQEP